MIPILTTVWEHIDRIDERKSLLGSKQRWLTHGDIQKNMNLPTLKRMLGACIKNRFYKRVC